MNSMASHVYFGEKANNCCKIKSHKGRERKVGMDIWSLKNIFGIDWTSLKVSI
jgi:hypothetical protein